jgi:hypothetical protein
MNVFQELKKFSNIKYYDEPHKYFIGEQELVSGTGFIKENFLKGSFSLSNFFSIEA